jgi:prepilin-type N-terminal cleavage/methylation domain-containing protein
MKLKMKSQGFTLIELMVVIAIIGILAMTAGPALSKYIARAKNADAISNLKSLFDGSVTYFYRSQDMHTREGAAIPAQFPGVGMVFGATPLPNSCCGGEYGDQCAPNPLNWAKSPWMDLGFGVSKSHYYWYEYISAGTGPTASFTARANGDLNCNQNPSLFERVGGVDPKTMSVIGGGGIFIANPYEAALE